MRAFVIQVRSATSADAAAWRRMRQALWPEDGATSHAAEIRQFFAGSPRVPLEALIAVDDGGRPVGFAELSIRAYAEECLTDRVAYLEGWYVGDGWLIFGPPPAEVAVHPSDENDGHELYLMCDDVEELVAALGKRNVVCGPVRDQGWGLLSQVHLPGGGRLGVYQPRHARPPAVRVQESKRRR